MLDDASRSLAIACMLIASRFDGKIPADSGYVKRVAYLNTEPDFSLLISTGFIEVLADASALQADARPEKRREEDIEKRRGETEAASAAPPPPSKMNGKEEEETLAEKAFWNWNKCAEAAGLPEARNLTAERTAELEACLEEHGMEGWVGALEKLLGSDFCQGGNDRGWRADIDWLMKPGSVEKCLEGKYDGRKQYEH